MNYALSSVVLALGVVLFTGCASHRVPYLEWDAPEEGTAAAISEVDGEAALAGAAAIRAEIAAWSEVDPGLFAECERPAQGLGVSVLPPAKRPTNGGGPPIYTAIVIQRFARCDGAGDERVLDWHAVYAVTGDGTVLGRARSR